MRRPVNWLVVALSLAFLVFGVPAAPPAGFGTPALDTRASNAVRLAPFRVPPPGLEPTRGVTVLGGFRLDTEARDERHMFSYVTAEEAERLTSPAAF